jgi:hypothetical protein
MSGEMTLRRDVRVHTNGSILHVTVSGSVGQCQEWACRMIAEALRAAGFETLCLDSRGRPLTAARARGLKPDTEVPAVVRVRGDALGRHRKGLPPTVGGGAGGTEREPRNTQDTRKGKRP